MAESVDKSGSAAVIEARRAALGLCAVAAALALGGIPACQGDGGSPVAPDEPASPGAAADEPVPGGTLVVAYPADADVLDPVVTTSNLAGQILDLMAPLLVLPRFDCRCDYRPHLARSWDWSDDGRTLTFHLRDDVTWSDGEPVDADDVLFTLDLVRDPRVGSPYRPYLEHLRDDNPIERLGDHAVAVHFDAAYDRGTMLTHAGSIGLVPEHALRGWPRGDLRGAPQSTAPVTAGAFALERWDRGHEIVLRRDAGTLFGGAPYLERVVFRIIPEYTTRLVALERGEVDLLPGLQVEDVASLRRDHPEIAIYRRGYRYQDYIAWNTELPLFADARVRRALGHAIDADTLIEALLTAGGETYGRRAVGTITPELCGVHNDDIVPLEHDPDRARALLAEAGWTDTDGDGWLDRDGRRLAFTLSTNAGNPRRAQAQVIIQQQLRQVGVDAELAQIEGNAFFERVRRHDYEAALTGLGAALVVDPTDHWHSASPTNYSGYANPAVDALIERGLATTDPGEAARCWRELQALVYADQPYCFLYWRDEVVAVNRRIRGVEMDVLWMFGSLHRWWVPEGERRAIGDG